MSRKRHWDSAGAYGPGAVQPKQPRQRTGGPMSSGDFRRVMTAGLMEIFDKYYDEYGREAGEGIIEVKTDGALWSPPKTEEEILEEGAKRFDDKLEEIERRMRGET